MSRVDIADEANEAGSNAPVAPRGGRGFLESVELWKPVPDGTREVPPGGVCPKCRSLNVHRSRTKSVVERVVRAFTPLRPFRCTGCTWRGWVVPVASQGPLLELPPIPSKPKRRSHPRTTAGKKILSPRELARARARRHVALAFLLAGLATSSLLYCQSESEVAGEAP